jgi:hypothetical protein
MFGSGIVKFMSSDQSWNNLTALTYHFLTQPLPNPIANKIHFFPVAYLKVMTFLTIVVEILIPVISLIPVYSIGFYTCIIYLLLQMSIILFGHFGFFNLLSCILGISLLLIICVIIYLTNGYNNINFKSIFYSIFFNLLFIILSQFILFYVIYTFIDPIKIYKFFYYDYDIKPIDTTTPIPSTLEDAESILKTQLENLKIKKPISENEQSLIIDSQKIGTIYIFNIIFICIFIIMFVLSLLNYLIVYNNYKIGSSIIPFTQFSLIIYIILGCLSLLIFIILLILLLNYF